jgi:hypothetical protein
VTHAPTHNGSRRRALKTSWLILTLTFLSITLAGAASPTNSAASAPDLAAHEKQQCTSNLKAIYQAIEAYQRQKFDLPNWLSDLVPQFLNDPNLLTCPVCRRTGRIEEPPLADPKIASSYLFEFCPVPLGNLAPGAPQQTRREWKRRQMGLVGSVVPMVRCRHHSPALNLAFDGRIYESPAAWEYAFTNRVKFEALSAAALFPGLGPVTGKSSRFLPRDPNATPAQIDLTRFYNAALNQPMHRQTNNTLEQLPTGLQRFAGVEFDVRGVVHLSSPHLTNRNYPLEIRNIPIKQKCQKLHFLHAAAIGTAKDEGKQVAGYIVQYTGNPARLEIPVIYGRDVRDWHASGNEPPAPKQPTIAWTGTNVVSAVERRTIRVFKTTWTNLLPDVPIDSIDYVSTTNGPAPFLIAITAE